LEKGVARTRSRLTYFDRNARFRARAGMQDMPQFAVTVKKTRPVCAYPEVAVSKGSGDTNAGNRFRLLLF
jgi:hypothetical protein